MTLNIDAATEITNELRFIRDPDDWDDRIGDITKRAVEAAVGATLPMQASGYSVNDAWFISDDTQEDGRLIITNKNMIPEGVGVPS